MQSLLLLSNGPELALHRHDREFKKNMHKFHILLLAHGDVALTNDMLKDYKVGKAYEYFSSGWLQEGYFLKAKSNNNNNLCILRTKCSPSQRLDDDPSLKHY
jgi:hypothetical protein